MNLLGKVRRLYYRDRLTLSEIERRTGLTRKTVRKWLNAPEGVEPKYRRRGGDSKIAPYAERLSKMLEIDARRSKRERRTALKLYAELTFMQQKRSAPDYEIGSTGPELIHRVTD